MTTKLTQKRSPIRAAREAAGLSREALAARAGVSCSTLRIAERAGLVSELTAAKVAVVLGVEADALIP